MKVIIFDTKAEGHHMEYLHHLYEMAQDMTEDQFVFVVPRSFKKKRDIFEWEAAENITFDYIDESNAEGESNILRQLSNSWSTCKTLRQYVKKHAATHVFSMELITLYPFAPLLLPRKLRLSGIIYRIYLHTEDTDGCIKRQINKSKFWLMARANVFNKILLLNDEDSASTLNHRYGVDKFTWLPDPFIPIPEEESFDYRKRYGIPHDAIIIAHIGFMSIRKGTSDILEAIAQLKQEERGKYWFVFAGVVAESLRTTFYDKYNRLKEDYNIIVNDEFCSYAYLGSLCKACDGILAPYHETSLSSGMLGYAAQYGKPLIVPEKGLIGHLVRKYSLGYTIKDLSPSTIAEAVENINKREQCHSDNYLFANSIKNFISVIRDNI